MRNWGSARTCRTLFVARPVCFNSDMTKIVEAIYSRGVLEPPESLDLAEKQRVRLIVQPIDSVGPLGPPGDRDGAMTRLRAGIASMNFRLTGPLPTRDELHDRV